MTTWQHPHYVAHFSSVCRDPSDQVAQLTLRDWLEDQGLAAPVADEALLRRPFSVYDIWSFRSGHGYGNGRGHGHGRGRGYGSGCGHGRGIESGHGHGHGSGSGIGRGHGSGIGRGQPYRITQMRIGEQYLVHCGDWHTFVGRVVAQVGPGTYEMEKVSKVAETNNGDCWEELAAGNEDLRRRAAYKHYKTLAVIPLVIAAFVWVGKLPQEW